MLRPHTGIDECRGARAMPSPAASKQAAISIPNSMRDHQLAQHCKRHPPVLPQYSAQSAGHWLYMSSACAEWQKRTASTASPKPSRYAP